MSHDEIAIHPKVWGEEHWIVNKEYCGKKLVLRRGYRCSLHYHKAKDEVFYIISGAVLMEVNGTARLLTPGMKQYIQPGDRHRFTGLEPSAIIEFSTHHVEEDSYRESPSGPVPEREFEALYARYVGPSAEPGPAAGV
jgi:mannose-6-phosphate isomerase-like protein (cupin superfamily)